MSGRRLGGPSDESPSMGSQVGRPPENQAITATHDNMAAALHWPAASLRLCV